MPALSASCRLTELVPGFPVLEISHPCASARLALHGAHLMEWTPAGQRPVLYLSPAAVLRPGKAIRGGIPVCWPWFGPRADDPSLPSHGFVRTRLWELESTGEDDEGVTVRCRLGDDPQTRTLWPHPFELRLTARLGRELEVDLAFQNRDDAPVAAGGALHTYLAVGDIGAVHVQGLDAVPYLDTVGGRHPRTQSGDLRFDREVDRIYRHAGPVRLVDAAWSRRLEVEQTGAKDLVAWNPWTEKGRSLGDLPEAGFRDFVCLEAANTDAPLPLTAPGATHRLSTRVRLLAPSPA